jgi:hypothetical protein
MPVYIVILNTVEKDAMQTEYAGSKQSQKKISRPKRRSFNSKRKLLSKEKWQQQSDSLGYFADNVSYKGKSEHKKLPGDFGLSPPANPRSNKSLCDADFIASSVVFSKNTALQLLKQGMLLGLIDERVHRGWPRHVWAVINGIVLEAKQSENCTGAYHGYPVPENDPLYGKILEAWKDRCTQD